MTTTAHDDVAVPASGFVQTRLVARLLARLSEPMTCTVVSALVLVLVAIGDYVTGIELPFTILYMFPIGLATWCSSRHAGLVLAGLATGSIALSLVHDGVSTFAAAWNLGGAAALLLAATLLIDRLHLYVAREQSLRRMAVDQLRHAERLNVIGTLAAGVAHEMGTPLNVITGCAELLAEEIRDDRVKRRTNMILEQVEKVSTIIRRLLDFGRRGGGTVRARVELGELAHSVTELLKSTANKRGASIVLERGPDVYVKANARELEQVLSNLILNALQAMDHGTVHVKTRVATRGDTTEACVEVEDEGCGIPRENIERIFNPFFTTKGVGEGTGLGLSVSYGIVREHGGWIDVASEVGHGSKFTVLLPLES